MKLRYARGVKEEQLEVVVAFLCGSGAFAVLPTGFRRYMLCMPAFTFELLGETEENLRLGYSLGTTLRNATNATYMTVQAKRASQGFIGQAERTRGTSLNYGYISFCTSSTLRSAPLSL